MFEAIRAVVDDDMVNAAKEVLAESGLEATNEIIWRMLETAFAEGAPCEGGDL